MAKFILSKKKVVNQYNTLKEKGFKVSYSLKTNLEVGQVLEELTDSYFSVHTIEELDYLNSKERVWFLGQAWNQKSLQTLFDSGVSKFIVDNEKDLDELFAYVETHEKEIDLMLRIKIRENTIFTGKYFVFGMRSKKINELVKKARANPKVKNLGIHFHRKTQNISEWDYKYELEESLDKETLSMIDLMDIGGGLPANYKSTSDKSIPSIFSKISELKEWLEKHSITMIIEPGRYLAASPVVLEANILNTIDSNLIIDCSVYNTSLDTLINNIKMLVDGEKETGIKYTIKGSTPCSMDIFRYDVRLDEKKAGDKIVFLNAGAYNFASDFCALKKLETEFI